MIKLRRKRWAGYVAYIQVRNVTICLRKPEGNRPLDLCIDGRITLKWILKKENKSGLDSPGSG